MKHSKKYPSVFVRPLRRQGLQSETTEDNFSSIAPPIHSTNTDLEPVSIDPLPHSVPPAEPKPFPTEIVTQPKPPDLSAGLKSYEKTVVMTTLKGQVRKVKARRVKGAVKDDIEDSDCIKDVTQTNVSIAVPMETGQGETVTDCKKRSLFQRCLEGGGERRVAVERIRFVRKVFVILLAQMAATVGWVAIVMLRCEVREVIRDCYWLIIVFVFLFLDVLWFQGRFRSFSDRLSISILLLVLLVNSTQTISCGYLVSVPCAYFDQFFDPCTGVTIGGITISMLFGLTISAFFVIVMQANIEFTMKYGTIHLTAWSVMGFILTISTMLDQAVRALVCLLSVLSLGVFIVHRTLMIMGETEERISYREAVETAMRLYIVRDRQDFLIIFAVLAIVAKKLKKIRWRRKEGE